MAEVKVELLMHITGMTPRTYHVFESEVPTWERAEKFINDEIERVQNFRRTHNMKAGDYSEIIAAVLTKFVVDSLRKEQKDEGSLKCALQNLDEIKRELNNF